MAPPGTKSPGQLVEILEEIRADSRFDGIFEKPGADNIVLLFELRQDVVLHYYHQLSVTAGKLGPTQPNPTGFWFGLEGLTKQKITSWKSTTS